MLQYPKYISANLLIYLLDILMVSSDAFMKQYIWPLNVLILWPMVMTIRLKIGLVCKYFRGYQVSDLLDSIQILSFLFGI